MRVSFDRFTFDSEQRILLDGSDAVHVGPMAFQLLGSLLQHAPRVLTKEELSEQLWPDTFVNESNLAGLINELRSALGDTPRSPRFIRTVHGVGYSFCGELTTPASAPIAFVEFRGRDYPLREGVNVLGRDPQADVQIDDATVSRRHASITIGDEVTLTDLASKNGTFIDGARVEQCIVLSDHQTFVLGDASVIFRRSPMASTVTVARP